MGGSLIAVMNGGLSNSVPYIILNNDSQPYCYRLANNTSCMYMYNKYAKQEIKVIYQLLSNE